MKKRLISNALGLSPEAPEFSDILHKSPIMKDCIAKARRWRQRISRPTFTGKVEQARSCLLGQYMMPVRKIRIFIAVKTAVPFPRT